VTRARRVDFVPEALAELLKAAAHYEAVFTIEDDGIVVVPIAHQKRRPGYWRKRRR
jgi:hypothetical protein